MKKKVYVYQSSIEYPTSDDYFRPDKKYPEYPWDQDISVNKNEVYSSVRKLLELSKLDGNNINTKRWNPLRSYIKPGNTVLIKPNLVHEQNEEHKYGEALYVQPSFVAPIIDYVLIALNGTGKIIIGDAPVQSCNFEQLVLQSGYDKLIDYYKKKNINILIQDFRATKSSFKGNLPIWTYDKIKKEQSILVDLQQESFFSLLDKKENEKLRITNYAPSELKKYHLENKHVYSITKEVIEADVIINITKPKTHRKAGVTLAMKNFVGLITQKECLPHHRNGSILEKGDEYKNKSLLLQERAIFLDKKNTYLKEGKKCFGLFFDTLARLCSFLNRKIEKESYREGAWYGNDTIWRMVLDINNIIVNYLSVNKKKKVILAFADMIVCGEKDGPLYPNKKNSGIVAFSDSLVSFDKVIATLMGFDYTKIPVIEKASKYEKNIFGEITEPVIISNNLKWDTKKCHQINYNNSLKLKSSKNWEGYCELRNGDA